MIRPAREGDAEAIARIYNHYVLNTVITFEEEAVSTADMAGRIADVGALGLPWLVAQREGQVVGYAYATRWRRRPAYRYSVESTVYLAHDAIGQGLGTRLYEALLSRLEEQGLHVVIGGIALPNRESVALHEKLGMRQVAHFREVGFKLGRWIDVGYWQGLLPRIAATPAVGEGSPATKS
jgi:L-amino acid N-acyltransferase YncA